MSEMEECKDCLKEQETKPGSMCYIHALDADGGPWSDYDEDDEVGDEEE